MSFMIKDMNQKILITIFMQTNFQKLAIFVLNNLLCHSLLMDLGHNQQQHPTVHSGGVSRGRVRGCGCWR